MYKSCFYLLTLTLPSISYMVFIRHFYLPQRGVKINIFVTFFVSSERFKDQEFSFQSVNLLEFNSFKHALEEFLPTYLMDASQLLFVTLLNMTMYMISELIKKKTPIMLMLLHLWKQPPGAVRYLKKMFTHHLVVKKPFSFFSNFDLDK